MAKKTAKSAARSASSKVSIKKKPVAKSKSVRSRPAFAEPRHIKSAPPKRFRLHKPIKHPVKLPSVWYLTKTTAEVIWQNKILFLGIVIIYGLLNIVFVHGLTNNANTASINSSISQLTSGHVKSLSSGLGLYGNFINSAATTSSPTAGPYQFLFGLITSLAVIWSLRQVLAGTRLRIRDAYYRGMYPLIPFVLVLLVICVQLIPLAIGALLYTTIISAGIAATAAEKLFWFAVFLVLALWSLYMITSSTIALYIVTLVDMTPLKALRSARGLVRHRRWTVLRKMLALPLILLILLVLIMLPFIFLLAATAQWVFFLLTMTLLIVVHSYLYTLYRELLNE